MLKALHGKETGWSKTVSVVHHRSLASVAAFGPSSCTRKALPRRGKQREAALKQIAYFESNTDKMRYAEYRARGLFIGSGVVEAGCKTVIGRRLKQSGMFWGVAGAQNVLDIRCLLENRQFGLFWDQYRKPLLKAA